MMRIKAQLSTAAIAVAAIFLAVSTSAEADTVYNCSAAFAAATSGLTTVGLL